MKKQIRQYSEIADINSSQDFYNRHTIYKGTWGDRMLKELDRRGYTVKALAGIFDIIDSERMTWEQFRDTDWKKRA